MAYKKEYPVLNSEKKEDSIYEYTKKQEDRISDAFSKIGDYVIESGSNSSGYWDKWWSGKMVQWGKFDTKPNEQTSMKFPINFKDTPFTIASVNRPGGYNYLSVQAKRAGSERVNFFSWSSDGDGTPSSIEVNWIAIGRWK